MHKLLIVSDLWLRERRPQKMRLPDASYTPSRPTLRIIADVTYSRLPESVVTLYAEFLDQVRAADAEASVGDVRGPFVSKQIRGRTYWYAQRSEGAAKRQIYLGPESPALLARIEAASNQRADTTADERRRRELVTMLEAGGMFRESAAIGTVLRVLADASVFRAGGVLVGTQAFTCIANMLGVTLERESLRTHDVDVAQDSTIPLGVIESPDVEMLDRLRAQNPAFFAVPGIDSREPSTSFKVRGRDLRVDFLTAANRRSGSRKPVYLPHLRVAAQPMPELDYVLEATVDAAVVVGSGVRVNIPTPARFALHKLWLSTERSAAEAAKARKDRRQAQQIIEVLIDERPEDLMSSWRVLMSRKALLTGANAALDRIDQPVREKLAAIVADIT
jgi:hypothetical protein